MDNETNVLPKGFDGIFRFTNWTDEVFKAKWNNVEYTFPAEKTSPMIISGETPEGVQSIRKKFAHELAEREFYKTEKFSRMNGTDQGSHPALYTESDLAPFIQRCLEPLPIATATATVIKEQKEDSFSKDEEGQPRTRVLRKNDSLVKDGTVIG